MNISQVQHLLNYLGYDTGGVEGIYGPKTKQAVRDFQREFGSLEVDGDAGAETQKSLRKAVGDDWTRPENPPEAAPDSGTGDGIWARSPYFSREEFRCRCGEYHAPYCNGFPVEPDETLVLLANRVRGHFGAKAHRTSAIRCKQHNADQPDSAQNSKHLYGKALDYYIEGVSGQALLAYVQAQPETNYAYIVGGNVVHMDVA